MKKLATLFMTFCALFLVQTTFAQWQDKSFTHQGNLRQYRVYKSPNYNASQPASLVVTLHGLGDDMTNFSGIGMNYVADTANIIVVVPQAVSDQIAGTAWNSGTGMFGYFPNSGINDVAFIDDLLDTIQANYAINLNRVYACGFSMGGFMTNRLAVTLNGRFTAFASVAGTLGMGLPSYNPNGDVRIAHFHGTADQTVPFAGNASGISADSLVNFWVLNDQCNPVPQHITVPDTQNDGFTIDHYIYSGGQTNTSVEFYKVTGADHEWLTPANDIFYTTEIWKFFNKHQQGPTTASVAENSVKKVFEVFPNPASDEIWIKGGDQTEVKITIVDLSGKVVLDKSPLPTNGLTAFSLKDLHLNKGSYLMTISSDGLNEQVRIVLQ
ncbi:MAG: T9SS type A sorting domain-containing protein [Fluviicola sp.]